ncbi:uncharacterized protein UDID_11993 [Ustilago sp. UG-2017a]|nr:uncharacterized protein UDID_11993 [Ustilago sp. UG-2017a]SPC66229.1 uncharacterized protein UHOD_11993 [Ustilago sp. UG-2017b]
MTRCPKRLTSRDSASHYVPTVHRRATDTNLNRNPTKQSGKLKNGRNLPDGIRVDCGTTLEQKPISNPNNTVGRQTTTTLHPPSSISEHVRHSRDTRTTTSSQ